MVALDQKTTTNMAVPNRKVKKEIVEEVEEVDEDTGDEEMEEEHEDEEDALRAPKLKVWEHRATKCRPPQLKNLRFMLSPFKGDMTQNVRDWVEDFNQMVEHDIEANGSWWTLARRKTYLGIFLTDDARRWYADQGITGKGWSFQQMVEALISKFSVKKKRTTWIREVLSRSKKTTETFMQYGKELRKMKKLGGLDEGVIVETFCSSLGVTSAGVDIAQTMMAREFSDLEEAIALAETVTGGDGIGMGVKVKKPVALPAAPVVTPTTTTTETTSAAAPSKKAIPKRVVVCFKCQEQGHIFRHCPNVTKCGRCLQTGHSARRCPAPAPLVAANSVSVEDFPEAMRN